MIKNIGIVVYLLNSTSISKYLDSIADLDNLNISTCFVNATGENINIENKNTYILNEDKNISYSLAINKGIKRLLNEKPEIEMFSLFEDGNFPMEEWLQPQLICFDKYPRLGAISPVFLDLSSYEYYSTWNINNNFKEPATLTNNSINFDIFIPIIKRNAFSITTSALKTINFLNEDFEDSFIDIDLSIRLTKNKIRLVCCSESIVKNTTNTVNKWVYNDDTWRTDHDKLKSIHGQNLMKFNTVQPKTTVECQIYNQDHLLEPWINNVSKYADEIIILFSEKPWQHNPHAIEHYEVDNSRSILNKYKDTLSKLVIVEGDWVYETDERNLGVSLAKQRGAKWMLIVDCDEFYIQEEIFRAFDFMVNNPTDIWVMNSVQLVKEKNWAALPEEGYPLCNFCIDLDTVPGFLATRIVSGANILIPYEVCKCWHLSYLLPKNKLEQKLQTSFHYIEFNPNWYRDIWPTINLESRNFHPTHPNAWSRMIEVKIPDEIISTIPYLN